MAPQQDGWEVTLPVEAPRTAYRFFLLTPQGGWWRNAAGVTRHTPTDACDFVHLYRWHSPDWVRASVFYQVFPDRFCDGDPDSNVRTGQNELSGKPVVARAWHEQPTKEAGSREFFGGDLEGLRSRLGYLEELGVDALYLNPIFTAPSNHKYDVADYRAVDPHLGGNAAFERLMREVHERDFRLILDVVPNHCGETHPWFVQARADPAAPTAEFFTFRRHPDEYESWLGVSSLPKLNYRSPLLREEMLSILRHWLRPPYRVDGWRLDVANMLARQGESQLGHKIGRSIRRAVKAENPEAYLLGEHYFDGTPHLQGLELDAVMNYRGFTMPVLHWLVGRDHAFVSGRPHGDPSPLSSEALAAQWTEFLAHIPWQIARLQFNQLGSHDTPRIRWLLDSDSGRLEAAWVLLFCFPGVPCVYYGDEVGLSGGPDPLNRGPMPWEESGWCLSTLGLVRSLAGLRRRSSALLSGGFRVVWAEGNRVVFERRSLSERLLVEVCRGAAPGVRLELAGEWMGLLHGRRVVDGELGGWAGAGGEVYGLALS